MIAVLASGLHLVTALASLVPAAPAAPAPQVVAGDEAVYLITVTNHGPSTAREVTVTDEVPSALRVVAVPDGCTSAGRTVTCRVARLDVAGRIVLRVAVRVDPDATGQTVVNLARTFAATADPDRLNNEGTAPARVVGRSDVSIRKSGPASTSPGRRVRYVLTARNAGPSTARDVVVTDRLPAGLRILRVPPACSSSTRTVECTLDRLAPGGLQRYVVTAKVRKSARTGAVLRDIATIGSSIPDPDPSDNKAVVRTTVVSRQANCRMAFVSPERCGGPAVPMARFRPTGP
ncbi:DUF11 domain-containing protein [Actinomadura barringtoniae]|uniref:DUF11 domain-containing protein n=1 Tax=Actinomadura barringtoniae TaxID=1427535 RepID=A0A939PJ42_9ACTN|nr:DUF11 domain-containing protein [Actinomadura barringtoniae]MBO2450764.1 DUF11 domain-containing protein [Actinomadura barringtoniae]